VYFFDEVFSEVGWKEPIRSVHHQSLLICKWWWCTKRWYCSHSTCLFQVCGDIFVTQDFFVTPQHQWTSRRLYLRWLMLKLIIRKKQSSSYAGSFMCSVYETHTSFPPLSRVTYWETTSCVCWEHVCRCGDEVTYWQVSLRRWSVFNSRLSFWTLKKTLKKPPKIPENAVSDALLMLGFQIFTSPRHVG